MSKTRRALLALLALAVLKWPLDLLLAAMLPDASVNPAANCAAGAVVSLLLLGLPAWLLRPWTSMRFPQKKAVPGWLLLGAVMAVLARAAMSPVDAAWQGLLGFKPDALPVPDSLLMATAYLLCLAIIPAITEEAFFRGMLLPGLLEGFRRLTAVLLTVLAFALVHGRAANLPSLLVISLLLTLLMLRTGRIEVAVTAHFFYNIAALVWRTVPEWGSLLCGAALIGLTAYVISRQPKISHPPMRKADGVIAAAAMLLLAAMYFI